MKAKITKRNYLNRNLSAIFFLAAFVCLLLFAGDGSKASSSLVPTAANNLNIGLRKSSNLVATSTGYMRVFRQDNTIRIEYYDNQFNLQSKKSLPMELELWGGFYAGTNAYYLVEGQANTAESDTAEVIRVIKYDTGWNRIGAASITSNPELFGGEVRYPFDYGCVEFAEHNGTLYIVTGHEGYVDPMYGQGHQGFLMIAVNTSSMTGNIVSCDLWHSFTQYIKAKDSNLYVLEQSEGSRSTVLSKYNAETLEQQTLSVLPYGGSRDSAWAISCYASVDGMELSSNNVLCIGTSIDQSKYDSVTSDTPHNIYLTVTPMSNFSESATTVKWLTNYTGGGKSFLGVKLTKINDNRFLISWEETDGTGDGSADDSLSSSILHYVFIDGNGNKISSEFTSAAPVSDCQPIVKGSKVVYYASNENMVNFYSIDASTGSTDKKMYRIAGETASWNFSGGVLTLSGTGEISVEEEEGRSPLSSTSYGYSYSSGTWTSIRDQVRKIVIKSGITSIPESCFADFNSLTEVEIESGLISIGKEAFYNCDALKKITIPSSVTTIGEDILWTGAYWTNDYSHVVSAAIYTEAGSFAEQYAEKNGISCYISLGKAKISGLNASYVYTGKNIQPSVNVKLNGRTLKKGTDYKVTYTNNKKVGTATVKVRGINHYFGTVTANFKIIRSKVGSKLTDPKTKSIYAVNKDGSTVTYTSAKNVKGTSLTIPSQIKLNGVTYKVTSIASNACKNKKDLKTVTISRNVTRIGSKAFYGCKKLTRVTLGRNITSIGNSAFEHCTSLKKVTIPSKVSKIGSRAFYNCSRLTSVTIQTKKLTSKGVGSKAFTRAGKQNYKKLVIKVPKGKRSAYRTLLKKKGVSSKASIK